MNNEALAICRKWVAVLGGGFHPDTRGEDYSPRLSRAVARDYEHDMEQLMRLDGDPYEAGIEAMREAGLLDEGLKK